MSIRFKLLGPLQVLDGEREVPLSAGRVQTVLAVLLLRVNQVTTVQQIAEYLVEGSKPALKPSAVQIYVARLRQALGEHGALVRTTSNGYVINLEPEQLDLTRFRQLVQEASTTDEPAERAVLLTEALRLWQGRPLADCGPESLVNAELPALLEEQLHAQELLTGARLELGRYAESVPDLTRLCYEHPLRERFWEQLMLALYGCGRRAEALAAYRTIARQLADELGIDPGSQLRHLHQMILTDGPARTGPPVQAWRPQCQLPLAVSDFVGRRDEITLMRDLLTSNDTVPIVAVSGPIGVGKTALAVRVAHLLRPSFPDGQWYARMTDADGKPRDPAQVLAELLTAAGAPTVPTGLEQRSAALRAALADKRVLLLLDDAHSAKQIQPLLPGTPGNAVLVTSCADLTLLAASHGGHNITLDVLDLADARALVLEMLAARRVEVEPAAISELLRRCRPLPSTLRTATANLTTHPRLKAAG